jgi:hypothetical protein
VEAELLGLEGRVVVLGDGVLGHEEGVLQAAGGEEAAAEAAQPAEALRLVAPGAGEAGVGLPAEGQPVQLAAADVHRPVDHDVELKAVPVRNSSDPRPPLQAVGQLDQPDAADLRQAAGVLEQLPFGEVLAPELHHARGFSPPPGPVRVVACRLREKALTPGHSPDARERGARGVAIVRCAS